MAPGFAIGREPQDDRPQGMVPCDEMARALEGKVPFVFKIGDAAKPAGVMEAMESAFRIAMQI